MRVSLSTKLFAIFAAIGFVLGIGIERSSLVSRIIIGSPSLMLRPGETYHYSPNPLAGVFSISLAALGAIVGATCGMILERRAKQQAERIHGRR